MSRNSLLKTKTPKGFMSAWEPTSTGIANILLQTLPSPIRSLGHCLPKARRCTDPLLQSVPNCTGGEPKPQGSVSCARSLSSAFFISALTYLIFSGKRYEFPRAIDSNTTIWCAADLPPMRTSYISRNPCRDAPQRGPCFSVLLSSCS